MENMSDRKPKPSSAAGFMEFPYYVIADGGAFASFGA
jgi:hypothetical protein